MAPMEKASWRQWNIPPWFITPMEKKWFMEDYFFEEIMTPVKDCTKDAMSIQISLMHYTKWTRVMLPVVFQEFELFFLIFLFFLSLSIGTGSLLTKISGVVVSSSSFSTGLHRNIDAEQLLCVYKIFCVCNIKTQWAHV